MRLLIHYYDKSQLIVMINLTIDVHKKDAVV